MQPRSLDMLCFDVDETKTIAVMYAKDVIFVTRDLVEI